MTEKRSSLENYPIVGKIIKFILIILILISIIKLLKFGIYGLILIWILLILISGIILSRKKYPLISILVFTLIAAAVAILLSDILIFPITYYSVNNIYIFNIVFKYACIFFIITACLLLLFFRVRSLHREGSSTGAIIKYIFLRPIKYFGLIFLSLILTGTLVLVLYIIFSNNYYLIYRLSGGV